MLRMVEGALRAPKLTITRPRALRRTLTLPEVLLWQALRRQQLCGHRFRRRHPVGPFVIDFYCPAVRLAIEIDGEAHDNPEQAVHDARRERWLSRQGLEVLRFAAVDVLDGARRPDVEATIVARIETLSTPSTVRRAVPLPRIAGEESDRHRRA